VEYNMCLLYPF